MLLAVGLVSLPGMMTGQILSGVSPLIAVRYQIMVMCMIFGSSGISAAVFLHTKKTHLLKIKIVSNNFHSGYIELTLDSISQKHLLCLQTLLL